MFKRLLLGSAIFTAIIGLVAVGQTVLNPQNSALVCAYNTAAPSLTAGTFGYVQCDSTGRLTTLQAPQSVCFTNTAVTGCTSGASQTWTVPANVSVVYVDAVAAGGGGGGGGVTAANAGGGGGGSGMATTGYPLNVVPGATLSLTLPPASSGGAHNADGIIGGNVTITGGITPFPTLVGGSPGKGTTGTTGGAGGNGGAQTGGAAGSGGAAGAAGTAATIRGYAWGGMGGGGGGSSGSTGGLGQGHIFGGAAAGSGNAGGGGGAGSPFGNGGLGGNSTPTSGAVPTIGYGGGGGGGGPSGSDGTGSGGNSAQGIIILHY